MEAEKKLHLLFLLPVVFHLSTGSLRDSLHCLNDFNNNITCEWNSTSVSDQRTVAVDTKCTLSVSIIMDDEDYPTSCDLRPFDGSKPAMRRCSLVYSFNYVFDSDLNCSINIKCEPLKNSLIVITYKPADHIKLSPPGRPSINNSTISWKVPEFNNLIKDYSFHIQWKLKAQTWKDALERNRPHCGIHCQMELDPEKDLELNETYQVRVRVLASSWANSTWSDWSPTASWRSLIGRTKTTDGPSGLGRDTMAGVIFGVVVLSLAIILCKTQTTWVYVVKKIGGPPLPNPDKFFVDGGNLQAWLNPQFNNESLHPCLKKVDISSIEVITSNADNIASCGSETALLDRKQCGSCMSTNSSYSNPNYSHICPPPISSLTEGNLEPCAADSPYGFSGCQNDREEERGKDMEIRKNVSIGSVMQVSSERVENLQPQCCGLFSPDSSICSGGEDQFSQDSLNDGDKASISDGQGKELQGKDRGKEKGKEMHVSDWKHVFREVAFSGIVRGGSIEVCSDYERVERLQDQRCGLQSPDSGICSGGEEQVSQDSLDGGDDISISAGQGKELQGTYSDKEKGKEINGSNVFAVSGIVSGGSIQLCSDYERIEKLQDQRCGLQSPDSGMGSEVEEQVSQETLGGIDGLGGSKDILFHPLPGTFPCGLPLFTPINSPFKFGTSSPVGTFPVLLQEVLNVFPPTRPIESSSGDYMPVRHLQC